MFEMVLITIAGIVLAAGGLAFGKLGSTPLSRAVQVPLVLSGFLCAALGISGYIINQRRISVYEQMYREDPGNFARAELQRVATFEPMYLATKIVAPLCFAIATILFWLSLNPNVRAIGLVLAFFGLYGLVVDAFSKERADAYRARISEALVQTGTTLD